MGCDTTIVGSVVDDVSSLDGNTLSAITETGYKLDGVGLSIFRGESICRQEKVTNGVVASICIAVVVRMLAVRLSGMNPFASRVERVITDGPRIVSGIDEVSLLVLMCRKVDRVARSQDNTTGIAWSVIGITACLIGESKPSRTIGTVVVLCA